MDALDSALKIEERLVQKATVLNIPLGGAIELTPLCNMNCDMCFIRLTKEEMKDKGQLRSVEEWLEIAREMKEAGTLFVLLTGGEPFLYPNFIPLYQGLKKLGMIITINTNGTMITDEIARVLGEDKPRRVNITLYGASNETYQKLCHYPQGYDKTIEGIERLLAQHIDIKLNGTIVKENEHEIEKLQAIANHYHLYLKMDTYIYPCSRERNQSFNPNSRLSAQRAAINHLKIKKMQYSPNDYELYKQYILSHCHKNTCQDHKISCRAGRSSYWLTWHGKMTPCIFMTTPSIDVFDVGFLAAWKSIVKTTQSLQMPEPCVNCQKRDVCQVCYASAIAEQQLNSDYMCQYTSTIIDILENERNDH